MWRRHHFLVQSAVQQLPCRRSSRSSLSSAAAVTLARRSKNGGGYQDFYSNKCVNKTSAAVIGSSHLQLWTRSIHCNYRTNNHFSLQLAASFSTTHKRGRKSPPRFSDDSTVDELVQIAHDNLDVMTPMATAALWNKISRQLSRRDGRSTNQRGAGKGDSRQNARNIDDIFQHTMGGLGEFSMRELTQTIFSMAKITAALRKQGSRRGEAGHKRILRGLLLSKDIAPNENVFRFLAGQSIGKLDQFGARHLSNLAYAYALINYVPEFDDGSDLFDHIAKQSVVNATEFEPQGISNVLWSYATVKKPLPIIFDAMGDQMVAMKYLDRFIPQHLSNTVWAYATADVPHAKLFEKVANHIVESDSLDRFKPQELSNTVWAYATAGVNHPQLLEKVANHILGSDSLTRFKPQALSNTVWAYATAGVRHSQLLEKVANHIVETDSLDRFNPQHLSNTVWAYATADVPHAKLFEKVANHIVESDSLDRFNPQNLSNTLWAYATAGVSHPNLFEKVADHIVESDSLHKFFSQALSNIVWAYATSNVPHSILFQKVADHIVRHSLDRFTPQELSNTVWAYATAQVSHPELFQKVASATIQRKEELNFQDVTNLLWAYAAMGIVDKQQFLSFASTAAKLIDSYTDQGLANIAWAYTVADIDAPTLFNAHFINKCVEKKDGFEMEALRQLHQWHLWQTKEKSNPGLPTDLQERCYNVFVSEEPTVSKLQDHVVSQLSSIGLDPQEEVLMDSGYRIDAIVEVNGKTVGVEVDGPSHFVGEGRSPTGSTILKRRQVPSIDGIELVAVPYREWQKRKEEIKRQEYLEKLLGYTNKKQKARQRSK